MWAPRNLSLTLATTRFGYRQRHSQITLPVTLYNEISGNTAAAITSFSVGAITSAIPFAINLPS
jgi:hypothetical protein